MYIYYLLYANHKITTKAPATPNVTARAEDIFIAAPGAAVGAAVCVSVVVLSVCGGTSVDPALVQSALQRGVGQLQNSVVWGSGGLVLGSIHWILTPSSPLSIVSQRASFSVEQSLIITLSPSFPVVFLMVQPVVSGHSVSSPRASSEQSPPVESHL